MTKQLLTNKEQAVVDYMKKGFDSEGCFDGRWYFTDEMRVEGLKNQQALGGVLASLEEKGIVVCSEWEKYGEAGVDHVAILTELMEED